MPTPAPDDPASHAAPKPAKSSRPAQPVVTQNRLFKLLIQLLAAMFFTALGVATLIVFFGREPRSTVQLRVTDLCANVCMTIGGALVGLVGGRAATPDRLEVQD